ncbi:MAG: hypothetical protein IPK83_24455 [Planctomycetes bacterium]|nr:hypothetical protein [Planctomycetota bacterium]
MRKESFDNLGAKAVLPSVLRSLQRPRQARFTSSFFRQCGQIEMRSRGGLYLGNSPGYTVKWSRIERAMARITRGLFYYEQKKPIPKGHQVVSWAEDNLYLLSNNLQTQLKQKLVLPLIKETPTVFGESVFRYWFKFLSETESNSVWLFEFYGRTRFIAFVADRDPNRLLERLGDKLNPSTDKEKPTPA